MLGKHVSTGGEGDALGRLVGQLEKRIGELERARLPSPVWTPVVRQNGATVAGTVNTAEVVVLAGICIARLNWTATAVGAVGNIDVTLPVDKAPPLSQSIHMGYGRVVGVGTIAWRQPALDATRAEIVTLTFGAHTTAIAIGNLISATFVYEAA